MMMSMKTLLKMYRNNFRQFEHFLLNSLEVPIESSDEDEYENTSLKVYNNFRQFEVPVTILSNIFFLHFSKCLLCMFRKILF